MKHSLVVQDVVPQLVNPGQEKVGTPLKDKELPRIEKEARRKRSLRSSLENLFAAIS